MLDISRDWYANKSARHGEATPQWLMSHLSQSAHAESSREKGEKGGEEFTYGLVPEVPGLGSDDVID